MLLPPLWLRKTIFTDTFSFSLSLTFTLWHTLKFDCAQVSAILSLSRHTAHINQIKCYTLVCTSAPALPSLLRHSERFTNTIIWQSNNTLSSSQTKATYIFTQTQGQGQWAANGALRLGGDSPSDLQLGAPRDDKKFRVQETLDLLTCADSSTDTTLIKHTFQSIGPLGRCFL